MAAELIPPTGIVYGPNAVILPTWAHNWLAVTAAKGGVKSLTVTSTLRKTHSQARIMFDYCEDKERGGLERQRKLYEGKPGIKILDEYAAQKAKGGTREICIAAMALVIVSVGPHTISHHMSKDPKAEQFVKGDIVTMDVSPKSISPYNKDGSFTEAHNRFRWAVNAAPEKYRFHEPPKDPAFHIELSAAFWPA